MVVMETISQTQITPTDEATHYYGYDGHGNVRLLTDAGGAVTDRYDYGGFGNLITRSGTTVNYLQYCGEYLDPDLGLYFLRARYMETDRGRFWTMDEFGGLLQDPQSQHRYLYVHANPVSARDPSGRVSLTEIAGVSVLINVMGGAFGNVATVMLVSNYDASDLVVAAVAGGIGGAIGSVPGLDPVGGFVGGFISSTIGALKKGCSAREAAYIGTVGGLISAGIPVALALKYPGFAEILESPGGGFAVGVAIGIGGTLTDEFLGLTCLR